MNRLQFYTNHINKSLKIPKDNPNPNIEEEQTTQRKEKRTKGQTKDLQNINITLNIE